MISEDELRRQARSWYEANWDPDLTVREWFRRMMDGPLGLPELAGAVVGPRPADAAGQGRARGAAPRRGARPALGHRAVAAVAHALRPRDRRADRAVPVGHGVEGWITCQMLSEPDAGSDLAGVRTRAERDGDEWVVTGSKIWTSNADVVDFGMLLARTNWDVPKHAGLTFFLIGRDQPGIEVRPLRQMTGDAQFNQVFFDEARVADADVLGPVGGGWAVNRTFLAHEKNSFNPAAHEGGPFGRVPHGRAGGRGGRGSVAPGRRRRPAGAGHRPRARRPRRALRAESTTRSSARTAGAAAHPPPADELHEPPGRAGRGGPTPPRRGGPDQQDHGLRPHPRPARPRARRAGRPRHARRRPTRPSKQFQYFALEHAVDVDRRRAPTRSSATTWPNGCSACRRSPGWTRTCRSTSSPSSG